MSYSIRAGLAAIALASAMTVAQAQTPASAQPPAMHGPGQPGMGPGGPQQMMMGGDSAGMMQMMLPMMQMMMANGGMGGMGGPMAMMHSRHVEGRIAFLKTELKITDLQAQQWNAFADVLRQNATAMMTMRETMMQGGTTASAPEQAERRVKLMSARLETMKAIAAAETALYAALSDEQKKIADELLSGPMGMM